MAFHMPGMRCLFVLVVALATLAAAQAQTRQPEIRLTRPAVNCMYPCTAYVLEVFSDGTLSFTGVRGVRHIGSAQGQIDAETLTSLRRILDEVSRKELRPRYAIENLADAGLIRIEYFVGDVPKVRVEFQPVLSGEVLKPLIDVTTTLERYVSRYKWIR